MQKEEISECDPPPYSVLTKCNFVAKPSPVSARNRNAYQYTVICTVDYSTETISGKWRTVLTLQTERFSISIETIKDKIREHFSKKTYDTSGLKII